MVPLSVRRRLKATFEPLETWLLSGVWSKRIAHKMPSILDRVRVPHMPERANSFGFTRASHGPSLRGLAAWWLLSGCVFLAGCETATLAPGETKPDDPGQPSRGLPPLLAFLATAQAGEATYLEDPRTGGIVRVVAARRYAAASGRTCRRFRVLSPPGYNGLMEGLACEDASGRWATSELLVNPDDLDRPRRRAPGTEALPAGDPGI